MTRFEAIQLLSPLMRRGIVTTDPELATTCCGLPRDEDGFCVYRPGHPVYVAVPSPGLPTEGK